MTIGEKLDSLFPAKCAACDTFYKRSEAKWKNFASRNICTKCGLDQSSAEAFDCLKMKNLAA